MNQLDTDRLVPTVVLCKAYLVFTMANHMNPEASVVLHTTSN